MSGAPSSFWVGVRSAGTGLPQARQNALLGARAAPHLAQLGEALITVVGSGSSFGSGGAGGLFSVFRSA